MHSLKLRRLFCSWGLSGRKRYQATKRNNGQNLLPGNHGTGSFRMARPLNYDKKQRKGEEEVFARIWVSYRKGTEQTKKNTKSSLCPLRLCGKKTYGVSKRS
jgi:hypothetical protein